MSNRATGVVVQIHLLAYKSVVQMERMAVSKTADFGSYPNGFVMTVSFRIDGCNPSDMSSNLIGVLTVCSSDGRVPV